MGCAGGWQEHAGIGGGRSRHGEGCTFDGCGGSRVTRTHDWPHLSAHGVRAVVHRRDRRGGLMGRKDDISQFHIEWLCMSLLDSCTMHGRPVHPSIHLPCSLPSPTFASFPVTLFLLSPQRPPPPATTSTPSSRRGWGTEQRGVRTWQTRSSDPPRRACQCTHQAPCTGLHS